MATTTLQLYWDLASFDATARQTAAATLIRSLSDFQAKHEETIENSMDKVADTEEKLDLLCASDVSYAVRRLLRGLSSSRQGARQGFSLALTELLAIVDCFAVKLILDLLFKFTERTKSMSGEEIRDMLFGRLFGLQSIVAAGMITRSSTTTEDILRIVESLHEMATTKSYLAEVCHHVVIHLLPYLKDTQHQASVVEKIKELFLKGPITNVDQLNLVIGIQQKLDNVDLSTQLAKWKNHNILHPANLKLLSSILKEIPIDTQEALAQWKPQLHSVWDPILNMYFSESKPKDIASFQEFWTVAVDNSMFERDATHGRKYWGFQLVEKVLRRLSSEQMPLIFTSNFMRTFINNLASEDRFLNRAARHTAQVIQSVAEENKQVGFALITQLLGQHGNQHFDRITKTKTVENLLTTMDTEGIQSYLEYLAHTFVVCGNGDDVVDEKTCEASRDWAVNQLTLLVTNSKIPKDEVWISALVRFFVVHSFFDITTTAENGSSKKTKKAATANGVDQKSYFSGLHKPTPALSQHTIQLCKQKFQSILVALSKLAPTEKLSSGAPIKTRKLNGMTNDGELWAYKVFDIYQSLKKDKKLALRVQLEKETTAVMDKAVKKMKDLRKKLDKMEKNELHDSVERGFEILLLNLILHTLINEEEGVSVLSEINDCYDKIFTADATPKRTTRNANKKAKAAQDEQEGEAVNDEEQPEPIDVIVDILVSFLTSESPVLKNLAEQVFEIFSHKLTKQSLENLISILAGDNKQGEDIFDDEDDDDVEMIDMDDVEMVDSDEEEEEDDQVDEEVRQKVEEAMKAQGINASENSEDDDDEEDLDDDAMAAFDEKLAEVFKQKKLAKQEGKTMQQNIVQFKNNVMELLVIYARKNPTNPLVLQLIVPLLNIIRDTPAKSVTNQFVSKIIAFLKTRLPKSHEYPKDQHNDDAFAILQAVHDFAKQSSSKDTSEMCVQLSLYLRKCILGGADFELTDSTPDKKTKKALDKLLAIYSDSIKFYLGTKSTHFSGNIIQHLIQRYPMSSWGLLDTLAVHLDRSKCANAYRLSMVTKWISLIVQRTVGKKSQTYNQKFINLAPKFVDSIISTIELSLKDDPKGLEYENMKLYLRFVALLIRLYAKVAPESTDVNKVWKTETIASITNNEKYSKPAISALLKQIKQ